MASSAEPTLPKDCDKPSASSGKSELRPENTDDNCCRPSANCSMVPIADWMASWYVPPRVAWVAAAIRVMESTVSEAVCLRPGGSLAVTSSSWLSTSGIARSASAPEPARVPMATTWSSNSLEPRAPRL